MDFAWWWYPLLLFAPDLGMIDYLAGPQIGAGTYNFVHFKGLGLGVYVLGIVMVNPPLQLAGLILFVLVLTLSWQAEAFGRMEG
ncbi:MAG: DUF4260 family protein [Chloroflexota bacterium]